MPADLFTIQAQILWAQRIERESVNAKARNDFSLRNSVSYAGVPLKFKPGHVDPSSMSSDTNFDPTTLGWDPNGPTAQEFRRCINRQKVGPRERHQFPETMQQDQGWSQGLATKSVQGRSEPAGSNPSKLGLGWSQKDGHGLLARAAADRKTPDVSKQMDEERNPRKPCRSKDGNVRTELRAPPFATSYPVARFPGAQAGGVVDIEVIGGPGDTVDASKGKAGSKSGNSSSSRRRRGEDAPPSTVGVAKSCSAPTLQGGSTAHEAEHFLRNEAALDRALEQSRRFLSRHPDSRRWYHPLSNSDVATFADNYTKCWGGQLYGKTK
mmetsp:Transcript_165513/g.531135  ORF Transcript_165513/g.531135 Transcript_165513/m.531135 type:complete len:324 (+) Transcript_165513:78-1049(+)|eukprot:CAMPEP_0203961536 /NCGR_PEP_ID=MMETSP0359-20131031/91948_1 /ASSEMBLY_ACC=CAM_ASM_000338 /TAXON_ID=268821 /ORGANISM="Scrippsiella Hangoei, Strain SHTV-5" /LENGTH=323 /DNA_ID=CAMNT_0050896403 /DNA_START=78 /DNA_END=1049 /DNA_ORIENTATION=+